MESRIARMALTVVLLTGMVAAHAQPPAGAAPDLTATLNRSFDKDPAAAFEEATRLFKEREAAKDLDGMIAVIRVTEPKGHRLDYRAPVEDMFDSAIPAAQAAGRWADLGDLYYWRARLNTTSNPSTGGPLARLPRCIYFAKLAAEAYDRAGKQETGPAQLIQEAERWLPVYREHREKTGPQLLGPQWTPAIVAVEQALGEGRDDEALALMKQCLQALPAETDRTYRIGVNTTLCALLWVRGADALLPGLMASLVSVRDYNGAEYTDLFMGVWLGMSGRPDAFSSAFSWAFYSLPRNQASPGMEIQVMWKML